MKMGNRDGALMRVLASHQCGLGSITAWCQMQVEFVIGPRLAPRVFSLFSSFPPFHKNQHLQIPI